MRAATSIIKGVNLIIGTLTDVSRAIPMARRIAGYALSGIGIEVRVLGVTLALGKGSIKGESRGTAFAFLSVAIPMGISWASIASFRSGVPVHGLVTCNAGIAGCKMWSIYRTGALPSGSVESHPWRAMNTFILLAVPDSWGITSYTESGSINVSQIRRAFTSL